MNITTYVKKNYDRLPKSTFNYQELVVVLQIQNENYGYGNHSYSGVGIDRDGKIFYCFSSGCSCTGDCGITEAHGHGTTLKKVEVNGQAFDLQSIIAAALNFEALRVDFRDY